MLMRFGLNEETFALELLHDTLSSVEAIQTLKCLRYMTARRNVGTTPTMGIARSCRRAVVQTWVPHPPILRHDQRGLSVRPHSPGNLKIVRVMCRRHLQQAGAKALLDCFVRRNRNYHSRQRNLHTLALEGFVARILRIEHEP